LQDKPQWFKRKPAIVKVHMLLLAHMARREIPPTLQKDLEFVLRKSPLLLEEMVKIANIPRTAGIPYGWLTPTIGAVELLQCLTQAVSIGSRKTFTHGTVAPPPPTHTHSAAASFLAVNNRIAILQEPGLSLGGWMVLPHPSNPDLHDSNVSMATPFSFSLLCPQRAEWEKSI